MELALYLLIGLAHVAIIGFLHVQNTSLETHRHHLAFEFLPREFDGLVIVHLSDLHNRRYGKNQNRLIDRVRRAKPDIIVMTGDMFDGVLYRTKPTLELLRGLQDVAPMYYVSGNHEWKRKEYGDLQNQLTALGVSVLDNRMETIKKGEATLAIAGIDDYSRYGKHVDPKKTTHRELTEIRSQVDERSFKILLVHRPELLREYMEHHFNLIFAGHAHGGQWDLPLLGPIFAPGQGLFPRLVSGVHKRHSSYMVISRGLGNSGIFAFQRLFNKPEIVVAILLKKV